MVKIHFHLIFSPACRHDNHFSNLHFFFCLLPENFERSYRPTMTTESTMNFKFSWINVRLSCHRWISSWDIISHRSDWEEDARREKKVIIHSAHVSVYLLWLHHIFKFSIRDAFFDLRHLFSYLFSISSVDWFSRSFILVVNHRKKALYLTSKHLPILVEFFGFAHFISIKIQ